MAWVLKMDDVIESSLVHDFDPSLSGIGQDLGAGAYSMSDILTLAILFLFFLAFLNKDFTHLFLETGEGGIERRRETSCERETSWLIPAHPQAHPQLGTWSGTQACAQIRIEPVTFCFAGGHLTN